jgi:hypothetical protein
VPELPEKREIEILSICEGGCEVMRDENRSAVVEMIEYRFGANVRTISWVASSLAVESGRRGRKEV